MRQPLRRHETIAQAGYRNLRPYMCPYPMLTSKGMKSRRPVYPVAIQQSHGRHIEFGGTLDKIFGQRCAFKKTECAGSMQFDIALSHRAPLPASDPE